VITKVIDRNFVSGGNRVRQKELVCQRERGPICCGRPREGQNAKNALTTVRDPFVCLIMDTFLILSAPFFEEPGVRLSQVDTCMRSHLSRLRDPF